MENQDKENYVVALETVRRMRRRFDRALEAGQVELHVALEDVGLLVVLAEVVLDARRKGQDRED